MSLKSLLLLAGLLGVYSLSQAQDYALFRNTGEYFYRDLTNQTIAAYRIDLVKPVGNHEEYHNYRTMVGDDQCRRITYGWPGLILHDGNTWTMISDSADSLEIRTHEPLNTPWTAYTYSNGDYLEAEIDSYASEMVLDTMDSVMTITFEVYNSSNQPIGGSMSNRTLKISKNHGLVEGFSFQGFPNDLQDLELAGGSVEEYGIRRQPIEDYFSRDVGDVFHYTTLFELWEWGGPWDKRVEGWRKEEVLSKYTVGGVVKMQVAIETFVEESIYGVAGSTIVTGMDTLEVDEYIGPSALSVDLPLESVPVSENPGGPIDHWLLDTEDWSESNGRVFLTAKQNAHWLDSTSNGNAPCFEQPYLNGLVNYWTRTYSEGLGLTYFSSQYGESLTGVQENTQILVYYEKGAEIWGDPIVGNTGAQEIEQSSLKVFPNPATDQVSIQWENQLQQSTQVLLVGMDGRTVLSTTLNSGTNSLDVSAVADGLYLLQLQAGESTTTHKLLIQH